MQYKHTDSEKYKKYLMKAREMNPFDNTVAYNLGQEYKKEGKLNEGEKLLQEAFDRWQKKFETSNRLEKWEYSWFSSCAREMGKNDYAEHIEQSAPKDDLEKLYNSDNLTQYKQEEGIKKY
jgi:tetratricopeptide (TPR) repeat protein